MYKLVSSFGKSSKENGIWIKFEINNYTLKDVFEDYSKIYVVLHNPYSKKNENLFLNDILTDVNNFNGTFSEYLISIGNKSLPTKKGDIVLKTKVAKRSDFVKADWKMKPISQDGDPTANEHGSNKTWLYIEKQGVDPIDFYKHAMVSVNGFYHFLDASEQGVWIAEGMKTALKSNDNHLSVLSFREIGELKYIKITDKMIYKTNDSVPLYEQCYIDLNLDTTNKTIILVLGGYLHVADTQVFKRVGLNTIKIDFKNTPYFNRYHESMDYLDIMNRDIEPGYSDDHISISNITSDKVIKNYLTSWQSFIVLIDTPDIYVKKHSLMMLPSPGKYISHIKPEFPMVFGNGMAGEYWDIYDHDEWYITLSYSQHHNRKYSTINPNKVNAINAQDIPGKRADFSHAYLLEIGTVEPEFNEI